MSFNKNLKSKKQKKSSFSLGLESIVLQMLFVIALHSSEARLEVCCPSWGDLSFFHHEWEVGSKFLKDAVT